MGLVAACACELMEGDNIRGEDGEDRRENQVQDDPGFGWERFFEVGAWVVGRERTAALAAFGAVGRVEEGVALFAVHLTFQCEGLVVGRVDGGRVMLGRGMRPEVKGPVTDQCWSGPVRL